jgi:hypothetical protein
MTTGLSSALNRASSARRAILYEKRTGKTDPHLHTSGFMKLRGKIDNFNMYIAIGHGKHEPSEAPVLVPHNVYLVFLTPPGYYGAIQDAIDPKFVSLIKKRSKFVDFMKGTLHRSQLPHIVTSKKWTWKHHIYPPGTYSAAHTLELYDKVYPEYDKLCGVLPITNSVTKRRYGHGTIKKLKDLVEQASRMAGSKTCMVFVSGCRGDPRVPESIMRSVFRIHAQSPPTYNLPMMPNQYIPSIRTAEANISARLRKPQYKKSIINQNIMRGMSLTNLLAKYPGNNNTRKYIESLVASMNWSPVSTKRMRSPPSSNRPLKKRRSF